MQKLFPALLLMGILTILFVTISLGGADDPVDEATITEVTATTSEKELLVFAVLKNSFTPEMIQGLHSGIPVHFSFFLELVQKGKSWTDKKLVSLKFMHTLTYDTLKEIYRVDLEETQTNGSTYTSLIKARKAVNEINNLKLIKLAQLQPDNTYLLRIKAELYKKTLPMNLHYLLPFLSWWDIETDWHTIEFSY